MEMTLDPTIPTPVTRFHPVTAATLLHFGCEAAIFVMTGDLVNPAQLWLYDGDAVDESVVRKMEAIGQHAHDRSQRRNAPSDGWGEMMIVPDSYISPDEMHYTLTPAGYLIPVPRKLVRPRLIHDLNEMGTQAMRYVAPPPPGSSVTYYM